MKRHVPQPKRDWLVELSKAVLLMAVAYWLCFVGRPLYCHAVTERTTGFPAVICR